MRKLYAVYSGEESDCVLAIFEERETAKAFVSRLLVREREERLSEIEGRQWALSAGVEVVGGASPSYIRGCLMSLNDPGWGKDFYSIEECDCYEGQELPSPGLVTTE